MSEDKVCTKDMCCSVGIIYDPKELSGVSIVCPEIGQGVTLICAASSKALSVFFDLLCSSTQSTST
jgi:hypothetical protein